MRFLAAAALVILALAACSGLPEDPLIRAARAGRTDEITALARGGADPNRAGGGNEWTPLMHAIHKNQHGSVIALLDAGANPNAPGGRGTTPLMMAAGYGQANIVRALLARGADPARRNRIGQTALEMAITGVADIDAWTLGKCQTTTVRALLDADPELAGDDRFRAEALRLLSRAGHCADIGRMLEENRNRASR